MGVEGYSLHREIVSFGMENRQETITRNTDTQLSKEKKESSSGVSTTDFVRSVLTTPTKLATVSLVDQRIHDTNTTDTLDAEATKASVTEPTTKPTEDLVLATRKNEAKLTDEAPKKAPVGGIAAMAAQAALKKNSAKQSTDEAPKKAPLVGIAAMAAQAALKRSEKKDEEAPKKAPVGGIAAMAAQAALKRSEKKDEEAPKKAPVGGIAAMAAQAALKRSEKKDEEAPKKAPVGGIAAMAAQAALKKNSLKQSIDEAPKKAPVGGTASLILISAVFEAGIPEAISNPRHLPAFYCLHLLVTCMQQLITDLPPLLKEKEVSLAELSIFSRRLLLRTLAISNQATSMGMIGWLEYGSSNPFDRALNLPFEVLQQIACNMAVEKDWTKASDILSSLLMRCEQNLPPCHPTTLSAMLDLAGALTEAKKDDFAKSIISGLLDLLSNFLSETESLFFDRRYYEDYHETNSNQVVAFDDCVDAVDIMQAFGINFHRELSRDFLKLLGSDNRIRLLNHSLVADSFSVLANCLSASEEIDSKIPGSKTKPTSSEDDTAMSRYFWSMAYSQYDLALRGWTKVESLIHPNAASITLSIARCLRELGKLNQALKILETLASCLEQKVDEILATAKATSFGSDQNSIQMNHYRSSSSSMDRLAFISRRHVPISAFASASPSLQVITCEREQTTVLCLWMMAVLTVEQSPDEGGRCRALSLLHTASLTLQRALNIPDNYLDDHTRMVFLDLYDQIEGEALDIFEPLKAIQLMDEWEASYNNSRIQKMGEDKSSPRKKRAPWEISTPMREKRQWTSPRAIRRSRDASATRSGNAANLTNRNMNRNSHASVQRL
jgi:tetratricopeptide (TPR) repeat protein